jgi:hypothetical protein
MAAGMLSRRAKSLLGAAPFVVVALAACGTLRVASPSPWDGRGFEELKPHYMQALDDRADDETAISVEMEHRLRTETDHAMRAVDTGALTTDAARAEAGLVLVYESLLLQRNFAHAARGKIDQRAIEGNASVRGQRAVALLRRAQALRPDDHRIASWLASAELFSGSRADAELTDAAKARVVAAVDRDVSFNLWTAFITLRDEPADTPAAQALFAKTRAYLRSRTCRDVVPGTREARNCESGPLAPYNLQAATVMLGDQFLRHGEDALRRGATEDAMEWLGTANGIYATLASERLREATARWPKAALLEARLGRLRSLTPGASLPGADFWRAREYEAMYDCASCHVR